MGHLSIAGDADGADQRSSAARTTVLSNGDRVTLAEQTDRRRMPKEWYNFSGSLFGGLHFRFRCPIILMNQFPEQHSWNGLRVLARSEKGRQCDLS